MTGPKLAKKAGIDPKSVNNMLRNRFGAQLSKIEAVAKVFGLTSWQLLRPTHSVETMPARADVERLIEVFYASSPNRRQSILSIIDPDDDRPIEAMEGERKPDSKTPKPSRAQAS